MSLFSTIATAFKKVKGLLAKAWGLAEAAGVNDEILEFALKWIRIANTKYIDNTERREFVVSLLVGKKIPESIARLIVELAYQLYRKEVSKKIGA